MGGANQLSMTRGQVSRNTAQVSLGTTLGATPDIAMEDWSCGTVFIPSGSPITTLTFYGAARAPSQESMGNADTFNQTQPALTYYQLKDASAVNVTMTVAAGFAYALPAEVFGLGSMKITVNSTGSVELSLKA